MDKEDLKDLVSLLAKITGIVASLEKRVSKLEKEDTHEDKSKNQSKENH